MVVIDETSDRGAGVRALERSTMAQILLLQTLLADEIETSIEAL